MTADAIGRPAQRVRVKVGIACGGARLGVPEQLADDRQPEAGTRADTRVRVPQVVNANTIEPGPHRNSLPWAL